MIFKQTFGVNFRDVGNSNKLTNKSILSFLEDSAGMHSDSVGFGINDIKDINCTWVLLNWKVRIFSRPNYGSKITIETWGRNSTLAYTFRDFKMYDEDYNLVAIASSKWVLLDATTMSLKKLTPDVMDRYQIEDIKVFENETEIGKLPIPNEFLNTFTYTVQRRDIDINKHVHNSVYLDLAYEFLPEEAFENDNFNNYEIMYKKEIKYGETVHIHYSYINNEHIFTIKSEDEKNLHAIIKLY